MKWDWDVDGDRAAKKDAGTARGRFRGATPSDDPNGAALRAEHPVERTGGAAATIRSATPAGSNLEGDGAEADRSGFSGGEDRENRGGEERLN